MGAHPCRQSRGKGNEEGEKIRFSSSFYPCQTSQTWRRFGKRGSPEGGAAATGCSETAWRDLCAHTASHSGRSCSPSPFLVSFCHSQTWQSNFSGFYATGLCTMLLFPIKLYFFFTCLTLVLWCGRCGTLGTPAVTPIPAGPRPAPLCPRGACDQQNHEVLYLL